MCCKVFWIFLGICLFFNGLIESELFCRLRNCLQLNFHEWIYFYFMFIIKHPPLCPWPRETASCRDKHQTSAQTSGIFHYFPTLYKTLSSSANLRKPYYKNVFFIFFLLFESFLFIHKICNSKSNTKIHAKKYFIIINHKHSSTSHSSMHTPNERMQNLTPHCYNSHKS